MHDAGQLTAVLRRHGLTRGRLYDASCGNGTSSNRLAELGFDVVCSTFVGQPALAPGIEFRPGVDLNRRLPFPDETFDCAVLQEVIEHLENPAHVVREFNRILKPGGHWLLTTPNAACLRSRLHFLLTGFVKGRRRPADYNRPPGNYHNLFIPSFPTLHYLLWSYGFRTVRTGRSARKWGSVVLWLLLFPLVYAWGHHYTKPRRRYDSPAAREACADLRRLVLTPHFLLDENLVLLIEKRHGIGELYAPAGREDAA